MGILPRSFPYLQFNFSNIVLCLCILLASFFLCSKLFLIQSTVYNLQKWECAAFASQIENSIAKNNLGIQQKMDPNERLHYPEEELLEEIKSVSFFYE